MTVKVVIAIAFEHLVLPVDTLSSKETEILKRFPTIASKYPRFRHRSLECWVLALIPFAPKGGIISDKRDFPRVPR